MIFGKLQNQYLKTWLPELIELNKSQLMEGKKSDGTNTPTYSQKYQAYKMTFSNYTSAPYANLNKTGDFFSGMYMKVVDQGLEFGSTDEKGIRPRGIRYKANLGDLGTRVYGDKTKG